jgi:hypothetical protein
MGRLRLAALIAMAVGSTVVVALAGTSAARVPTPVRGWANLPPAARAPILAALRRERPAFAQHGELAAAHGARGEEFGESVAISGNTIVVGTPNYVVSSTDTEQGAAYVFVRPASGWGHAIQAAVLTARKGLAEELFGHSVAVDGNTIVIGAPFRAAGNATGVGAAYVFVRPRSGWRSATQTGTLHVPGGRANDFFGESVAISANTIVVGAPGRRVGSNDMQGVAYVFDRPATGWTGTPHANAELTASDGRANDAFGISVATSGRTIVAGADLHTNGTVASQGAAYVYVRPATGWAGSLTQAAELTAKEGQPGELLAHSLAISQNTIVVGAPYRAIGQNAQQGVVYVFVQPLSGWRGSLTQTAELTASDGVKNEALGRSVAISHQTIVCGATFKTVGRNPEQGAVYVFVKPPSGWRDATQTEELTIAGGTAGDSLGRSVAAWGNTLIAGAPDRKVAGNLAQGAVYAFIAP